MYKTEMPIRGYKLWSILLKIIVNIQKNCWVCGKNLRNFTFSKALSLQYSHLFLKSKKGEL